MRATVTLDKDVERLLRKAMHSRGKPFKDVLNDAIRAGLGTQPVVRKRAALFVVKARPMGLRSWMNPTGLNQAADELEIEGVLARRK